MPFCPKVIILCGGMGLRLREFTESIPKPMIRIGEMPIIWHVMNIYSQYKINDFILCTGYKGEEIKKFFENYKTERNVNIIDTGLKTQTGGRINIIKNLVEKDEYFLATYSDGIGDINISNLINCHKKSQKIATITGVNSPSRFGIIQADKNGIVTNFAEKPPLEMIVNGGFFVFDKKIFKYLDDNCSLEMDVLPKIAKDSELAMYKHELFWKCMDTYKDYEELCGIWDPASNKWKI